MDVSIIFVNYKTSHLIQGILDSIKEKSSGFSYEIIIVDNSNDCDEFLKLENFKNEAVIIDAKQNLGFGKANNLGATFAKGKYLFFLNTDTLLVNNAIYELKKFLDEYDDTSIVGSNLYTKDLEPYHSFIQYPLDLKGYKKLNSFKSAIKKRISKKRDDFNYSNSPVLINGYVCGAALMIRKDDFDKLSGFDNDIFMYDEETLLCYRVINEFHKKIYNVPSSKIIHFEGGSFNKPISFNRYKIMATGNKVYCMKAFGLKETRKIFKYKIKNYKIKKIVMKLTFKTKAYEKFSLMQEAYRQVLLELE